MPISVGSPSAGAVSNVINIEIPVWVHVEHVLAVGRDDALVSMNALADNQICADAARLRSERTGAGRSVGACRPFENVEHQVTVILHHYRTSAAAASARGPQFCV